MRLAFPVPHAAPSADERRLRGRALGTLWTIGTTLLLGALLIPDDRSSDNPAIPPVAAAAYLFAAAMFVGAGRVPRWMLDVTLAAGTALLALLVHSGGGADSPFVSFFLWQLVFAAYFLPRPRAMAQALLASVAYSAVVLTDPAPGIASTRWIVIVSTFVVVTLLVVAVRRHVDTLVSRLAETARTDPLTGLPNRRTFDEALASELRRASRSGEQVSLLLIDLDHFKAVNDGYGHPAGDRALQHVARLLRDRARAVDLPARLGGEEFAVLMPATAPDSAMVLAERLRIALEGSRTPDDLSITASVGVGGGDDPLSAADRALYEAKAKGRNRCVLADR